MKAMALILIKRTRLNFNSILLASYLFAVLSIHFFVVMQGTAGGILFWISAAVGAALLVHRILNNE